MCSGGSTGPSEKPFQASTAGCQASLPQRTAYAVALMMSDYSA